MKMPKNLGKIVTNASFILLALAVVVAVGGRIFAQSQSSAQIDISYGNETSVDKISNLDTSYVDSNAALATFTEGQKCDRADNACLVKTTDNNRMFNAMFAAIGSPDATTENSGTTSNLFNSVGKMIAWTYQKPVASGSYYVADALDHMGLAPATYAQGYGYYALSPYLQIWRVFRNLAYIFFTVIVIVIGVLILFRQRIGGQAAVTAQQALPRIVIALLLVTFSYAIAGFMIDLMYWIMYAFASFIKVNNVGGTTTANELVNGGFSSLFKMVFWGNWDNIWGTTSALTSELFSDVGKAAGDVVGEFLGKLAGGLTGILASLIIIIVLFVNLFRLLFILLKSYAIVLLNIIFAPMNLMLMAIPGVNTFKKWIMSIIANLSPFVVVFFMIVIMGVTNSVFGGADSNSGQGFVPPYTLSPSSGSFTTSSIGTLVGLAIMLAMPQIVESIKKKLDSGGGFFSEVASAATDNFKKGQQTGKKVAGVGRAVAAPIAGGIWGMANQKKLIDRGEIDPDSRGKWFKAALIGGAKAGQANKNYKLRNAVGARVIAGLGGAKNAVLGGKYGYVRPDYDGGTIETSTGTKKTVADYLDDEGKRKNFLVDVANAATKDDRDRLIAEFGGAVALGTVNRNYRFNNTDIDRSQSADVQKKQRQAIKDLNKRSAEVLAGDYSQTRVDGTGRTVDVARPGDVTGSKKLRDEARQEFEERVKWAKGESWREGGTSGSMLEQRSYDDSRARESDKALWSQYLRDTSNSSSPDSGWIGKYGTVEKFEYWRRAGKGKPNP
ncbi:MAG: hypothetical protein Q4G02_02010 [bacterium]|nr:hypothetical protein [bacterium]